jgi:hypothetical protein
MVLVLELGMNPDTNKNTNKPPDYPRTGANVRDEILS